MANEKVKLNNVRLSFEHIFEPQKSSDGGADSYSANFLLGDNDKLVDKMNAAIEAVAKEKWGAKAAGVLKTLRASGKMCLGSCETKDYDGYEDGEFFVSANNKRRPSTFDRGRNMVTQDDNVIYSGCYVNAVLEVWAQDNAHGKRVNAALMGVQFVMDGDAFGAGGVASEDDFDVMDDDDEFD